MYKYIVNIYTYFVTTYVIVRFLLNELDETIYIAKKLMKQKNSVSVSLASKGRVNFFSLIAESFLN